MATKTLYVGNVPYSATADTLQAHFAAYNSSNARLIDGRGFGFVDIDEDKLSTAIAEMHEKDFQGRSLTVNEAQPKGTNRSSDSRGGGGGGGRW